MKTFSILKKLKRNITKELNECVKNKTPISQPASEEDYTAMKKDWDEYGDPLKRFTFYAPVELQERIRNMSFWTRIPVSDIGNYALAQAIEKLEKEYNFGFPWKNRPQDLSPGRPSRV